MLGVDFAALINLLGRKTWREFESVWESRDLCLCQLSTTSHPGHELHLGDLSHRHARRLSVARRAYLDARAMS